MYSEIESEGPAEIEEVEEVNEDRYFLVRETHMKTPYRSDNKFNRIRYHILTKKDAKGRISLHRAAEVGDKHFCTMIVEEAKDLSFVEDIID